MKSVKNDKRVNLRISQKELNIIKKNMEKFKIDNLSFFLRTVAINPSILNVEIEPIIKLNYEINKIGVNINQVVKLANKNKEIKQEDIKEIKHLLKEIESIKVVTTFLKDSSIYGSY